MTFYFSLFFYSVTDLVFRCIQGLVRFAQPILDMICDVTGWKCTLVAGGPEPAHGGRLNVIRYFFHYYVISIIDPW